MKKISFCQKNDDDTKKLYKFLKSHYKGIQIKRKDCLGKCKTCKNSPFSLIDGEVVKCKTVDRLYQEINERMLKEWKQHRQK